MNDWQQQQETLRRHELQERERRELLQQQEQDRRYRLEIDREEQVRRMDVERNQNHARTWMITNWLRRLGPFGPRGSRSNRR